jgi:hypothetical protein
LDSPLHTACDIERNSTFSFSSLHMAQLRNCYFWTEPHGTARDTGEAARFSAGSPPAVCAQTNRTNMWVPSQESSHRRETVFTTKEKHQRIQLIKNVCDYSATYATALRRVYKFASAATVSHINSDFCSASISKESAVSCHRN